MAGCNQIESSILLLLLRSLFFSNGDKKGVDLGGT